MCRLGPDAWSMGGAWTPTEPSGFPGPGPQALRLYTHSCSLAQIYRKRQASSLMGFLGKPAETQTYSRAPLTVLSLQKDLGPHSSCAILSCGP